MEAYISVHLSWYEDLIQLVLLFFLDVYRKLVSTLIMTAEGEWVLIEAPYQQKCQF